MKSYLYQLTSLDTNNRDTLWLMWAEEEFIQGCCIAYKFPEKVGEADLGKEGPRKSGQQPGPQKLMEPESM